jgi:short-subunit dehydrogenase
MMKKEKPGPEPKRDGHYHALLMTSQDAATEGYALVTGACSGIGFELASELARRGLPLILVSNRETELTQAALRLAQEHAVPAMALPMDLAQPAAAHRLYREVQRRGLEVDILVCNAGMFFFAEVAESDPDRANAMLQLHVVTPSLLAHYFGRDMRARRRGHIMFVSSISAWRDFPGIAWYGSSKRYLRSFAAALREEMRIWGVNVTCVAPGAVATGLYAQTGVPVETAVKLGVMKHPSRVAKTALRGMFKQKAVVIPGFSAKAMALGMAVMPGLFIRLVRAHTSLLSRPDKPGR